MHHRQRARPLSDFVYVDRFQMSGPVSAAKNTREYAKSHGYACASTIRQPSDAEALQIHISGFGAELAVAIFTGRKWKPITPGAGWKVPDIQPDIEVRSTKHGRDPHLVIRPNDVPERRFVLVVGVGPRYELVGWIRGTDGRRPEWWANMRGNRFSDLWWVPPEALRPVAELKLTHSGAECARAAANPKG